MNRRSGHINVGHRSPLPEFLHPLVAIGDVDSSVWCYCQTRRSAELATAGTQRALRLEEVTVTVEHVNAVCDPIYKVHVALSVQRRCHRFSELSVAGA